MKAKKYKHLSFEDRCVIEEYLNHRYNFTQIANRLQKDRTCISKEVFKHRFLRGSASVERPCCFEYKPPYVCNGCDKFNHCKKQKYSYSSHIAFNEYKQTLISERANLNITKEQIASLSQEDCYLIASHINSTPRLSLNNNSPYDLSLLFIGQNNINKLQIKKIDYDDIDLSYRLLKK